MGDNVKVQVYSLSEANLHKLLEVQSQVCRSVFSTYSHPGAEKEKNMIRLKNLLQDFEGQALPKSVQQETGKSSLESMKHFEWDMLRGKPISGFALFGFPGRLDVVTSSLELEPLAVTGTTPVLAPLIKNCFLEQPFYALRLALEEVELLEVDSSTTKRVEIRGLKNSFREFLEQYDLEKSLQFRVSDGEAQYHGHGAKDNSSVYSRQFLEGWVGNSEFRKEILGKILVIAGVREKAIWAAGLCSDLEVELIVVPGSFDGVSAAALGDTLRRPVRQHLEQILEFRFSESLRSHQSPYSPSSDKLEQLEVAAEEGRIESLFVSSPLRRTFKENQERFWSVERLVRQTLQKKGEVFPLLGSAGAEEVSPQLGLYRY